MKILIWQVLLVVGVGQKAASSTISVGSSNAPYGRSQRGTQSWTPPAHHSSAEVTSSPVNYWFKTGVVDEERGFMQGRAETKRGDQVVGSYQYSDGHVKVKVVYTADDQGYRIVKEERETMRPPTQSEEETYGGQRNQGGFKATKFRSSNPAESYSIVNDVSGGKSSSYSSHGSQSLEHDSLGNDFDLQLHTDHGTGYSKQGFALKSGKTTNYPVKNDVNFQYKTASPTISSLLQEDDVFNDSVEDVNENILITDQNANLQSVSGPQKGPIGWNKPYGNRGKRVKALLPPEGFALFIKKRNPRLVIKPKVVNPVIRSPRRQGDRVIIRELEDDEDEE